MPKAIIVDTSSEQASPLDTELRKAKAAGPTREQETAHHNGGEGHFDFS
jgi:hypothetical protein